MNPTSTEATPDGSNIGLDRVHVGADDQIKVTSHGANDGQRRSDSFDTSDDEHELGGTTNGKPSKRKSLAAKTKKILHIGHSNTTNGSTINKGPVLADAPETHSDSRYVHDLPPQEEHKLKDIIHDPVDTVKSKVTGQGGHQIASNVVAKEVSHGREVELVQADDRVQQARTRTEKLLAINDVKELVKQRQDMFVRWTVDRHITKVRVLPRNTVPARKKSDFKVKAVDGKERMDWESYAVHLAKYYSDQYGGQYIGEGNDPPKPSKENVAPNVERLLVATAPFQELIMTARRIYRWEDRSETSGYLATYALLWTFDLILPGVLAIIIYLILHRKLHPPNIDDLRKDIKRTENRNETALTVSEFIEKEGDQRWVDPLIDQVGPWAMVQLADLANLMEVLRNFYEWRVPSRTGISLVILTGALIAVTFTPLWLLVRVITLSLGVVFFGLFPIASRFPEYRLLASPIRWVFWKIPTHGEWAIKYLQAQGQGKNGHKSPLSAQSQTTNIKHTAEAKHEPDPLGYRGIPTVEGRPVSAPVRQNSAPPVPPKDLGVYSCRGGSLTISSVGVRFEASGLKTDSWSWRWENIKRLEKEARIASTAVGRRQAGDDLKFVGYDDVVHVVQSMEKRDEAFSQILGFSPVEWQIVW